jgi:DNA-binding NarL/FixJ family response regulator
MLIKTQPGEQRRVSVSTVTIGSPGTEPLVLQLLRNGEDEPEPEPPPPLLTPRQLEVLRLLAEGVPAKVIAARLEIAPVTVRNHIQAILTELRCHSQLQAVAEARRRRLL